MMRRKWTCRWVIFDLCFPFIPKLTIDGLVSATPERSSFTCSRTFRVSRSVSDTFRKLSIQRIRSDAFALLCSWKKNFLQNGWLRKHPKSTAKNWYRVAECVKRLNKYGESRRESVWGNRESALLVPSHLFPAEERSVSPPPPTSPCLLSLAPLRPSRDGSLPRTPRDSYG